MAIHHAAPDDLIDVRPLGQKLPQSISHALFKTAHQEVMRTVLRAGQSIPEHSVPGEITIQCIEGEVELRLREGTRRLRAGEMTYLAGCEPHAFAAITDTSMLMTILLEQQENKPGAAGQSS